VDAPDYCREIEAYLCRKNDGHLIRVVGPSFDVVAAWAARGVPLKIAFAGIDRYFERYYRNGPRRRPVRIDFCEDDVLDVFEEWVRATGITATAERGEPGKPLEAPPARQASLPAHIERVLLRLTAARATGRLDPSFDPVIDRVAAELERLRTDARQLRGALRLEAIERLTALDRELLTEARRSLDERSRDEILRDTDRDLAAFKQGMAAEAYGRAREAAIDQLTRERLGLPTIVYRLA
jgi:hypothetical protein